MRSLPTVLFSVALTSLTACAEQPDRPETAPLASNVIARVDGTDIPADWFIHEFRSSFFKHMQEVDVRSATFEPFLKRMILAEQARQAGLADRPDVKQEIERRIAGMRAYMEYQLAMTEIGILNQALVEELNLAYSPDDVTDEELIDFFDRQIKGQPGAPSTLDDAPPQALDGIRRQIAMQKTEDVLDQRIEAWSKEMNLEINEDAIQAVPIPEMKGNPPGGFGPDH